MSENSAGRDIEPIEDTISHISEDELIHLESVAPDENSSSMHPSSTAEETEWLERGANGSLCKYCKEHGRVNQSNRGTWIKVP